MMQKLKNGIRGSVYDHPFVHTRTMSQVPSLVTSKIGRDLHRQAHHPVSVIKNLILGYFKGRAEFSIFEDLPSTVSVRDNFDLLRIPVDHPSRSRSDTYYVDEDRVLRTHTSAHQNELLAKGYRSFLVTGDVYRRDEVDRFHYPVFHQMEGVHVVAEGVDPEEDLKETLSGLVRSIFPGREYRFNPDYFPFTEPSYEIEVKFGDRWLEILGCGVVHPEILSRHGIRDRAWAFGFGLERWAMTLFEIPDIRLFWSSDPRFLSQFREGQITPFKPYPVLESISRDISFWIAETDITKDRGDAGIFKWNRANDFYEVVRETFGDNVERVSLHDMFYHEKKGRYSHTFRITISAGVDVTDPGKFTEFANASMERLRDAIPSLGVVPR